MTVAHSSDFTVYFLGVGLDSPGFLMTTDLVVQLASDFAICRQNVNS